MKGLGFVIVVGAGRVGRTVATTLSAKGESVLVVDCSEQSLGRLPPQYTGFKLLGNAADVATLHRAEMNRASRVFATSNRHSSSRCSTRGRRT
jgi:trk system potassium uptake protein TrkA